MSPSSPLAQQRDSEDFGLAAEGGTRPGCTRPAGEKACGLRYDKPLMEFTFYAEIICGKNATLGKKLRF
jgi:hypothetical protein